MAATIEGLGRIADEPRERALYHSESYGGPFPRRGAPRPALTLGSCFSNEGDADARTRREVAVPVSIGLHAGAAAAIALVPLLLADALPRPARDIRAFFVEPLSAPAAPPPPPPPAATASVAPRLPVKTAAAPAGFVAPIEVPEEIRPEEGLDLGGVEGGVPGGVEGGVPGGVVGGIVGGLPDAPPPPPAAPVRVGGNVRQPRKVVDAAPVYPDIAAMAHLEGVVVVEATIDTRGRVVDAKVLRGVPVLDEAALEAVRKWVYTPTLLGGVPTPVIITVTVDFRLKRAR